MLERREIYSGRIVQLGVEKVELPNGSTADFEVVSHPGAVAVAALDDHDHLVMVRHYRHAPAEWLLEVPAGKLDPGEAPDDAVTRELEEETGVRPRRIEPLGPIWATPGFCDERIWLFLATDLEPGHQSLEHDEVLEPVRVPWPEAIAAVASGEISDAKTICALLMAKERLGR